MIVSSQQTTEQPVKMSNSSSTALKDELLGSLVKVPIQAWSDDWKAENKGSFTVITHEIRIQADELQPWHGSATLLCSSFFDGGLKLRKIDSFPNKYTLKFKSTEHSNEILCEITESDFEAIQQHYEWNTRNRKVG